MVEIYQAAIVGGRRGVHQARAYQVWRTWKWRPFVRLMTRIKQVPRLN